MPGDLRSEFDESGYCVLRQVLPVGAEERVVPGFGQDPVGDLASVRGQGLLQKYAGRALLVTTGACATGLIPVGNRFAATWIR